mgnify:CR=1 FL=1
MKAEVRFYEKGFVSAEVPEIKELREELDVASKDELVEAAKEVKLPASAEYANICVNEEPVIGIGRNGIRDIEAEEWIVEPESTRDYIKRVIEEMDYESLMEEDGERAYLYHVEVDGVNIPVADIFSESGEEAILVRKDWNEDIEDIKDYADIEWIDASEVE